MAHIPPSALGRRVVRKFQAPNLLVLTRSSRCPVPVLDMEERDEKTAGAVGPETGGGKKGEIRGKSRRSSSNCSRVLSSIDWRKNGRCLHVTLTYWRVWPNDKEHLALEKSALVRDLGRQARCGLWSLEYQIERHKKTGEWVPHWHVLLWIGDGDPDVFETRLRTWWARFSSNPSKHAVAVTSGDQARGTWYLAMHAAKLAQSPPFAVGRWWGYVNRDAFLAASDIHATGEAEHRELVWWARLYRRSTGCKVRQSGLLLHGFSWFLPRSAQCVAAAWIRDHIDAERRERRDRPESEFPAFRGERCASGVTRNDCNAPNRTVYI